MALRYDPAKLSADLADATDEHGFETELLIALLSHARVDPSEVPPGTPLRGYWADSFDLTGEQTGSRLWLLEQAVANEANARRAEAYALDALRFLVSSERVRAVHPVAELERETIAVTVKVTLLSGVVKAFGPYRVT